MMLNQLIVTILCGHYFGTIDIALGRRLITERTDEKRESNDCECVPFYQCANNTVITDGSVLIDVRLGQNQCTDSVEVCCGNVIPHEDRTTPRPTVLKKKCGKRNEGGLGFKILGTETSNAGFAEFPWMVALLEIITFSEEQHKFFQCGGTLIHERVVLTAAHCVSNKSRESLILRAGEWDTQTAEEPLPNQDRKVSQVIVHENFYEGALINDVALLIADEAFVFNDNVQIVCLPKAGDDIIDDNCIATGWGKDVFGKEGRHQVILRKVTLPIVPREKCLRKLQETKLGPSFRLHDSFTCAGGNTHDTCEGDGGGPLICPVQGRPSQYHQAGIVSWGIKCGGESPGVYVNVAKFRSWIDARLAELDFVSEYDY